MPWLYAHWSQLVAVATVLASTRLPDSAWQYLELRAPRATALIRCVRAAAPDLAKFTLALYCAWTGRPWRPPPAIVVTDTPTRRAIPPPPRAPNP